MEGGKGRGGGGEENGESVGDHSTELNGPCIDLFQNGTLSYNWLCTRIVLLRSFAYSGPEELRSSSRWSD